MIFYSNELEFNQAAINFAARLISERASSVIATGNVADIGEECLEYLEYIAADNNLSAVMISTYLDIIRSENENIRLFFDK